MDKIIKKKINELKNNQEYDKIYAEFGQKIYNQYVPSKYKKEDLKKLKAEGRYEVIFSKYGKDEYNRVLSDAKYREIKEEQGLAKAINWKVKDFTKKFLIKAGILSFATLSLGTVATTQVYNDAKNENAVKYEKEIENFNEKTEDYAEQVKNMNLSDIQVCMKVMQDMWSNIKGYDNPKIDAIGYMELDVSTEDGVGMCRNMASYAAKTLNAIDSKYNARTIDAYIDTAYQDVGIENRNILTSNETVEKDENAEEKEVNGDGIFTVNHMVTLVDIPEDNITLMLDPTNPSIGIYQDGKIYSFNAVDKENGYKPKEFMTAVLNDYEGKLDTVIGYAKSFLPSKLTLEELNEKYGVDAQKKALAEVKALDTVSNIENSKKNSFEESIKVDFEALKKEKENNNMSKITSEQNIEKDTEKDIEIE